MSSMIRRMQRKFARSQPDYEKPEAKFVLNEDGSYEAYHPTRGWRHVSAQRARLYG